MGGGGSVSVKGNQAAAALMVLTAVQVPGIFAAATPDQLTIAKSSRSDEEVYNQLRRGEVEALILALLVGAASSAVSQSPWPFVGCLVMSCYIIWKYEQNLNK